MMRAQNRIASEQFIGGPHLGPGCASVAFEMRTLSGGMVVVRSERVIPLSIEPPCVPRPLHPQEYRRVAVLRCRLNAIWKKLADPLDDELTKDGLGATLVDTVLELRRLGRRSRSWESLVTGLQEHDLDGREDDGTR